MKILIVACVLLAILYYVFPLIKVIGYSMYPTYFDGEIIVGTRLFRKDKLKVGEVVLYKSPVEQDRIVIKRISQILIDGKNRSFYCLGDNASESYDSRYYGFISSKNLVCKVINQREDANNASNQKGQNYRTF